MNKYRDALYRLDDGEHTIEDFKMLQKLANEKDEQDSRKDKLVVGSEWECVAGCDSKHLVYDVGDVVKVLCVENGHILLKSYAIRDDVIKEQQFMLCFKPKEKSNEK